MTAAANDVGAPAGGTTGKQPARHNLSWRRRAWWAFLYTLTWLWMVTCYRYSSWGRRRMPRTRPCSLASKHQCRLEPIPVGLGTAPTPCFAVARSTLFKNPVFTWLIKSLNAIPVRQGESDLVAMRKAVDVLKQGHRLMIFPEGARTPDGAIHTFKPGTMLLIKRAKVPVVPVAIEGGFEAWPVHDNRPHATGRIGVMYGRPIPAQTLLAMSTDEALAFLRDKVEALRVQVRERLDAAETARGPLGICE